MADRIGPTFLLELIAAGVSLDGWNWCADGTLTFGPTVSTATQTAAAQVLAAHDPTRALPTIVTGNQWAFALSDMGLSSAWRIGVTKSKDSDQVRAGLIARDTPLVASDPLLIRVAGNAGLDAGGNALISVPVVFVHAQGMPT